MNHRVDDRPAVGVLAAWGRLPIVVAESMRDAGYRVVCLGVRHHAVKADYDGIADAFHWIGPSQLGTAIRLFRRYGVERATMAGKFHKVTLYQPGALIRYLPDWTGAKAFYSHFVGHSADRKDDTLLGRIVEVFATGGVTMEPATDFAPGLLVEEGLMGRLDVGQSVCVKGRAAIAIEAIEGTDLCIRRAGELCRGGGFTVVKVAKPNQDMRFDVPTVGVQTLQSMKEAGARVLAIEAGLTILLDPAEFRAYADRHRLTVVAQRRGAAAVAA
ncbi:lpxI [Symbiodinium sp. CCMP2456]|nr:lpxI [Symbiodinium sp. CCMP2456]